MDAFFRNARARNTHVEATLNHSCAAQVQQRIVNAYREEDREITGKLRPGMEKMLKDVQELFESTQVGAVGRMAG